ncbi:hypothetical protein VPNG_01766 [Cytospora leucostoma]|uniref:BTB domain-containing protein n=1 Tax=Cytospora leucostoma TaxID=1230097 RepID=A0A423XIK8_9PEZI|nr:hypothetical protein VPNG_01766 [Cytospora leucostoma]
MSAQANQGGQGVARPEVQPYKPSLFYEPQAIVTVKVEGQTFKVHKKILVTNSEYFEKALNGPFLEAQTQTIDLEDDVKKDDFGLYVDTLYRWYFAKNFHPGDAPLNQRFGTLHVALHFWMLSDRFLNIHMRDTTAEWLKGFILSFTVPNWKSWYDTTPPFVPSATLNLWVLRFQLGFNDCQTYTLPFTEMIVQAAANMPPELFSSVHDMLEPEFRSAVTKKFIRRFVDPKLERPPERAQMP